MLSLIKIILRSIPELSSWIKGSNKNYLFHLLRLVIIKVANRNNYKDACGDILNNPMLMEHVLFTVRCLNKELNVQMCQARERDLKIRAISGYNLNALILTISIILMVFCTLCLIFYYKISSKQLQILSTIAIIIFSCLKDIVAFEFGSTDNHNKIVEKILVNKIDEIQKSINSSDNTGTVKPIEELLVGDLNERDR